MPSSGCGPLGHAAGQGRGSGRPGICGCRRCLPAVVDVQDERLRPRAARLVVREQHVLDPFPQPHEAALADLPPVLDGAPMGLVKRRDPYWASNVSGGLMSGWAGLGWDLVFGAATLLVAFNYRDAAWRIHGFMANTVGINRLLTPTMVRVTCGVLAAVSIVGVAVSAARL